MEVLKLLEETTPNLMIEKKYDRAKFICTSIWDNPDKFYFEDVFHDTILKCLVALGNNKFDQDYLKDYFFKAFRINMVRHYGYAYNKLKSGEEISDAIIPIYDYDFDNHLDGFGMLDYVEKKYGLEIRKILWDNLTGIPYNDLDKIYHTNTYYLLTKIKDDIKRYYGRDMLERKNSNLII